MPNHLFHWDDARDQLEMCSIPRALLRGGGSVGSKVYFNVLRNVGMFEYHIPEEQALIQSINESGGGPATVTPMLNFPPSPPSGPCVCSGAFL